MNMKYEELLFICAHKAYWLDGWSCLASCYIGFGLSILVWVSIRAGWSGKSYIRWWFHISQLHRKVTQVLGLMKNYVRISLFGLVLELFGLVLLMFRWFGIRNLKGCVSAGLIIRSNLHPTVLYVLAPTRRLVMQ